MNKKDKLYSIIQQSVELYNSMNDNKKLTIQAHFNDTHLKDKQGDYIIYDKVVGILEKVSEENVNQI